MSRPVLPAERPGNESAARRGAAGAWGLLPRPKLRRTRAETLSEAAARDLLSHQKSGLLPEPAFLGEFSGNPQENRRFFPLILRYPDRISPKFPPGGRKSRYATGMRAGRPESAPRRLLRLDKGFERGRKGGDKKKKSGGSFAPFRRGLRGLQKQNGSPQREERELRAGAACLVPLTRLELVCP